MSEEKRETPFYTGMIEHRDMEGGFSLWIPSGWYRHDLKLYHTGVLYTPYADDINTSLYAEKSKLKFKVTPEDLDTLRDGFNAGLENLPGIEIESKDESLLGDMIIFDARYTFLEGIERRKRWARSVFWSNRQLVIIAQGRTPEDFQYWLPMFYDIIMTARMVAPVD